MKKIGGCLTAGTPSSAHGVVTVRSLGHPIHKYYTTKTKVVKFSVLGHYMVHHTEPWCAELGQIGILCLIP